MNIRQRIFMFMLLLLLSAGMLASCAPPVDAIVLTAPDLMAAPASLLQRS